MKTIHFRQIIAGLVMAVTAISGYAYTHEYAHVVYELDTYYWTVIGTTLTADMPNRSLYITPYVLREYSPDNWGEYRGTEMKKYLPREIFANNDIITDVNPSNAYTKGWFGSKAFYNASSLGCFNFYWEPYGRNVETPDSVFMNSHVSKIHLGTAYGVTMPVGKSFAEGTTNLESVYLGTVSELGVNAFKGSSVTRVWISELISKTIPEGAFENSNFTSFSYEYNLSNTMEITHFGKRSFKNSKVTTLPFSSAVTVEEEAFDGTPLEEVVWSANLSTIGARAFRGTRLEEVFLPPVIESIGEGAFAGCDRLGAVYISNPEPPAIVWDAANPSRCSFPAGVSIYVPSYAVGVYKNFTDANGTKIWANYDIQPLPSRRADGSWEWRGVIYSKEKVKSESEDFSGYEILGFTPRNADDNTIEIARGPLNFDTGGGLTFFYDAPDSYMSVMFTKNSFPGKEAVKTITTVPGGYASVLFEEGAFEETAIERVSANRIYVYADAFKNSGLKEIDGWMCVNEGGLRDTPRLEHISKGFRVEGPEAFKKSGINRIESAPTFYFDGNNSDCLYEGTFEDSSLKSIASADGTPFECRVSTIRERAFKNAPLEKLDITWPNLTTIEEEAFSGTNLDAFAWGDKLAYVGREAFAGTRFEKLRLPATLKTIDAGAFARCEQLTDVWALTIEPPAIVWDDNNPDLCTFPPRVKVHTMPSYVKFYQSDEAWKHYIIMGDGQISAIDAVQGETEAEAISVVDGRIVADGRVEVYTPDGRLLASGLAAELPTLPAGLYIVRTPAATAKIVIR